MKDYREKIKKLLALAESNNEFEAKAALLKAKELMAEYKIEEIDLEDVKKKNVKTIVTSFEYAKRGEWWIGSLAMIIAENYCCRSAGMRNRMGAQKRSVMFVGLEGDVEICAKIFGYAVDTARSCGKNYLEKMEGWKHYTSAEKNLIKNSYAIGFARGVKAAFDEQNAQKQDESGWGLVMIVPKEVNDACSGFVTDRYASKHRTYTNVKNDGYKEGKKFNPNNKISVSA